MYTTQSIGGEITNGFIIQLPLPGPPTLPLTPAVPSEHERVFSSAKKLLIPERNALVDDIIEVTECLKAVGSRPYPIARRLVQTDAEGVVDGSRLHFP